MLYNDRFGSDSELHSRNRRVRSPPMNRFISLGTQLRKVPAGDMEDGTLSHYSGMAAFLKPANIPSL